MYHRSVFRHGATHFNITEQLIKIKLLLVELRTLHEQMIRLCNICGS